MGFSKIKARLNKETILNALIIITMIVFIGNTIFISNLDLVDGTTHLRVVKALLNEEQPKFERFYQFPTYYLITYAYLKITQLNDISYAKTLPVILFAIFVMLVYKIYKQELREWKIPLLLTTTGFWVIIFFSVNYIDPLIATLTAGYVYLFLREYRNKTPDIKNYILMGTIIILIATSKLTGLIYFPVLTAMTIGLGISKSGKKWKIIAVITTLIVAGLLITVSQTHMQMITELIESTAIVHTPEEYAQSVNNLWLTYFMYPPNPCLNEKIFGDLTPLTKIGFMALTAPIIIMFFYGIITIIKNKRKEWMALTIFCILGLMQIIQSIIVVQTWHLPRYAMPVIFLLYAIVYIGTQAVRNNTIRRIIKLAMVIYIIYALAFTVTYAMHFKGVNESYTPSEEFARTLVQDTRVCGQGWMRGLYLNNIKPINCETKDKPEYIWEGCYSERRSRAIMKEYIKQGQLEIVYEDDCATIYKVIDQNIFKETNNGRWGRPLTIKELEKEEGAKKQVFECH